MKKYQPNGYTLVELLAVIFILVAVGTLISSILTSVLRSSNKGTNTEAVRTNGNNAISQMSKMITYAQKLEGVSVSGNFNDPTQYQADCSSQPATTKYYYLRIKSFDTGITTFACANSQISSISSVLVPTIFTYLVDPTLSTSCYFQCLQASAGAPAKIDIVLDITATSTAVFSENQATMHFETSVLTRNSGDL
jgi:type II secretory pathway pseudopilin PulG